MRLAVLSATAAVAAASSEKVSPVQKVLQLLADLETKVIKEGEVSQKTFDEYSEWCEERAKNLGYEIETGKTDMSDLSAAIERASSEMTSLQSSIEETSASIAQNEADLKAAEGIRAKEAKDFKAEEKELMDVVSSLERAIIILEREMQKAPGSAALAQIGKAQSIAQVFTIMVDASMLQTQDADRLTALVQNSHQAQASSDSSDEDDSDLLGAPDPAAYKSHSGSIVDTLQDLLDKGRDQLETARKKEANAQHNFDMVKQSLTDELKFANMDMSKAKKDLAGQKEAKASAEGDLSVTKAALEEDTKLQGTLKRDCLEKAQDFEAETKSRAEELKALAAAKEAITESTGGADAVTYGSASFLQFVQSEKTKSSLRTTLDLANFEIVHFVRDLAEKQHSDALMQLSRRIATAVSLTSGTSDPFAKVKKLIQDMLEKLENDAEADASHKAYCDKEMGDTLAKETDKKAQADKLNTEIDSASSRSAQLKEEVAALQQSLAEMAKSQAEMDKIRSEEKAVHTKNKAELEAGLEGVKMALKILREYYAKDADHEAAEGAGSGIIGLLEVVESDFTKNAAEMTAAESTAQAEYDRDTKENQITKATKDKDIEYKTRESVQLDAKIREAKSDLDGVQTELAAITEYKTHLDQACIAKPSTYEERKAAREAEIAGLKEALSILEGNSVLLQKHSVGHRLRGKHAEIKRHA